LEELHLYGSARLGILKKRATLKEFQKSLELPGDDLGDLLLFKSSAAPEASSYQQLELGRRRYELSNHLGNVLATVSDKSLGQDSSQTGQADYYLAQVFSASLYYPFGWEMPGRKFVSGEEYRFGFNGKEDDRDWGMQNIQDYGFRLYNPSIGKFLSVDPLSPDYPMLTCYQFAHNCPIAGSDLDGLEFKEEVQVKTKEQTRTKIEIKNKKSLENSVRSKLRKTPRVRTSPKPSLGRGGFIDAGLAVINLFGSGGGRASKDLAHEYDQSEHGEFWNKWQHYGYPLPPANAESFLKWKEKWWNEDVPIESPRKDDQDDEYITLYRGTDNYAEQLAYDDSGLVMSQAAITQMFQSKISTYKTDMHEGLITHFGSIERYALAHGGSVSFLDGVCVNGVDAERTLISFTENKKTAHYFGSSRGGAYMLFEIRVKRSDVIKQPNSKNTEAEYLVPIEVEPLSVEEHGPR
ncbi:RHS repeat domain-containing protein, partial [Saprospira grandis]|uniref:RHS repeat domain-containing protein n=1 Tax=Saprospira grandis TaxID=1008 RepID=UPI0009D93DE8